MSLNCTVESKWSHRFHSCVNFDGKFYELHGFFTKSCIVARVEIYIGRASFLYMKMNEISCDHMNF